MRNSFGQLEEIKGNSDEGGNAEFGMVIEEKKNLNKSLQINDSAQKSRTLSDQGIMSDSQKTASLGPT